MKKIILSLIAIFSCLTTICSAYMEDKVFCTISKNSITITMDKNNNYKCSEYLSVLSQAINAEYNDVIAIQKLISQWYDVEYRKEIRDDKRENIKRMIVVKDQIENAIKEFDLNLFSKIKEYIVYTVSPYMTSYKKALKSINNINKQWEKLTNDIKKKIKYLEEDITVLNNIIWATDYDTLIKNYNRHLYLKTQIEWK